MEMSNGGLGGAKKTARGFWTSAQKQLMVDESNADGANVADVARRHSVRPALLSSWRRQFARVVKAARKGPAKFVAVRVKTASVDGIIEIDLAGGCVRIHGIVDGQMLREVLAAAR